jgi:hypothetical protein
MWAVLGFLMTAPHIERGSPGLRQAAPGAHLGHIAAGWVSRAIGSGPRRLGSADPGRLRRRDTLSMAGLFERADVPAMRRAGGIVERTRPAAPALRAQESCDA